MAKVSVPSKDLKTFYTYAKPLTTILVTAVDDKGAPNIITLAWHTPISIDPPLYGISVGPKRYSHELIRNSGEFVVNYPSFDLLEKVHHCGSVSGRKEDKFRQTGLTPLPSEKVGAPGIAECYLNIECRLVDGPSFGDHTWFVGEVVNIRADDAFFDAGLLRPEGDPILYMGKDLYQSLKGKRAQMRQRK